MSRHNLIVPFSRQVLFKNVCELVYDKKRIFLREFELTENPSIVT
jgi:hypothetical protein